MNVRKERIPVRGLKPLCHLSIEVFFGESWVRKERIPVRGLKPCGTPGCVSGWTLALCQKRTNPREGIETVIHNCLTNDIFASEKNESP